MRETFLFLAGGAAGAFVFAFCCLARELYGFHQEDKRCKLCGERNTDGYDADLGPVCAQCEVELSQVGAQLVKLSGKIL